MAALADTPGGPGLRLLDLGANPIAEIDLDRLAAALGRYPNLQLDLGRCPLPRPLHVEVLRRFGPRVWVDHPEPPRRNRRIIG